MGGSASKAAGGVGKRALPKGRKPFISKHPGGVGPEGDLSMVVKPKPVFDPDLEQKDTEFVENMFMKLAGSVKGTVVATTDPTMRVHQTFQGGAGALGVMDNGLSQPELKEVYKLAGSGSSVEELAARYSINPETLERAFKYTQIPHILETKATVGRVRMALWPGQ
eukprot:CAMPEP_0182883124 /NCGR_PEP_ID=MMETSP0034_2-20130328/18203_1 /TAXON_ID=156128 /ORGANISM="Nephroselmis pyriformis, Strain CCMP717" /LENGTH=165 /DNA_ID=CAMNT_0025016255 /DNA_START=83 /DNA_END=577 /DNA_ORIENTATION=-